MTMTHGKMLKDRLNSTITEAARCPHGILAIRVEKESVSVAPLAPGKELADSITPLLPSIARHSQISEMLMYSVGGSASQNQ